MTQKAPAVVASQPPPLLLPCLAPLLPSSGKSTLINALLGQKVLPSLNVPETARIVRVRHAPERTTPLLSYTDPSGARVEIEGAAAVNDHLRQLNKAARNGGSGGGSSAGHSPMPSPRRSPGDSAEEPLLIAAPISALVDLGAAAAAADSDADLDGPEEDPSSLKDAALGASSCPRSPCPLSAACPPCGRVSLLDTPGPNEEGADHLRFKVERLLEGVDCVLFLLDYTKLKTRWALSGEAGGSAACGCLAGSWPGCCKLVPCIACLSENYSAPPCQARLLDLALLQTFNPCMAPCAVTRLPCCGACMSSTPPSSAASATASSLWSVAGPKEWGWVGGGGKLYVLVPCVDRAGCQCQGMCCLGP